MTVNYELDGQIYEMPDDTTEEEALAFLSKVGAPVSEPEVTTEVEHGGRLTPEQLATIDKAGEEFGIETDDLVRMMRAESQFDMEANKGTKKAQGAMQFFRPAWADATEHLKKRDIELTNADKYTARSALAAAAYQDRYRSVLGDDPSVEERYALHLLGPSIARKTLEANDDVRLGDVLSKRAIKGNPSLFPEGEDTTKGSLMKQIAIKMDKGEVK